MKRTLTLFAAILLLAVGAAAQKLSYQAVVRNSANELVYDATVSVSLKILAADGVTVQYAETQTTTTNQNGLLTLIIGEHPTGTYSLANVNWTDASIRTDITLPSGDVVTNTMPVTAVPYALYADDAGGNLNQVQSDWTETNTASKAYIQNKPTIPTAVSQLTNDVNYITVNQVPAQVQSDWAETNTASTAYIQNKPVIPAVPTSVSAFQNDANYITINQVPAQVQSDWAETNTASTAYIQNKPVLFSGNYSDLTGAPTSVSAFQNDANYITINQVPAQVQSDWAETNTASTAYIQNKPAIPTVPTNVSAFQNDAHYITVNEVPAQVQSDWAETNTASTAYIQNKPNIPVVNNATLTIKQGNATLGTFTANASVNQEIEIPTQAIPDQVNADWNATDGPAKILNKPTIPTVPTNVSAFQNDAQYVTQTQLDNAGYITGYTETDPQFNAWNKDYNDLTNKPTIPTVPTNVSAFQNDAQYVTQTQLDNAGYITGYTETDPQFNAWDKDYNDLTNKPTIPTVPTSVSAFQNDAGYLTSYTETDPQFNAWDKDYNDLTNKPNIPVVNNATLTIKQGNATLGTFTANASVNQEIEIPTQAIPDQVNADWNATDGPAKILNKPTIPTVPTNVSAFQNDAQYVTQTQLDNAGYITGYTETDPQFNAWNKDYNDLTNKPTIPTVPTNVSAFQNDAQYVTQTQLDNAGYITGYTETDPQFNAWDKDYNDLTNKPTIPTVPTSVSAFQNDAGYLTSYTETQSLADVTANGNSAGNRQLKNVSDPTDAQDAVTKSYLTTQTDAITASIQQQLDNLASQYQQQLNSITSAFQHQLDSLGGVIGAQQHLLDSLINGGSTPIPPTPAAPTATTSPATDLTQTSATLNGTVSNPDNVTITAQGFEWKTTEGGTYAQVNAMGETMAYSLTGLTANTSYTYRAFVTTASGTSYGEEVTFTTLSAGGTAVIDEKSCPEAQTVTDHEGNVYATVQTGNQCWMRDNLRTTTSPSTGTYLIPAASTGYTYTGKQARWYNNDSATYAPMNYGLLYNWNAAVDTFNTAYGETSVNTSSSNAVPVTFTGHRRGICPAGWHLPSDAEWNTMEATVSGSDWQTSYETSTGYRGSHAGKLAGGDNWTTGPTSGAPGDYGNADRNVSGFSAVPAGYCHGSSFNNAGNGANFWSSSQSESYLSDAWYRDLNYYNAGVSRDNDNKGNGYSVRCLRDESGNTAHVPTVTTGTATDLTQTFATLNGTVSNPDNVTIASKGFEYKALGSTAYTQVAATGTDDSFSSTVSNLAPSTEYTYRAFVTYDNNTVYGSELNFTTLAASSPAVTSAIPCTVSSTHPAQTSSTYQNNGYQGANHGLETVTSDGKINSVTDYDGNEYPVVQIGSQCWLAENMRCTHAPSTGTYIVNNQFTTGTSIAYTYTGKMARWYNNDSATYASKHYGLLYNWNAAVDVYNTSYGELSVNTSPNNAVPQTFTGNRQGICPRGWHVPSDDEWTSLTDYVSSQSSYQCSGNSGNIGKALASIEYWSSYSGECYPGDQSQHANNATGFAALPVGYCGQAFIDDSYQTFFWASYDNSGYASSVANRGLGYDGVGFYRGGNVKYFSCSVRCLRDESGNGGSTVQTPTVTTGTATSITDNSATLSGSVTNPDNVTIASKGFEYKAPGSTAYTTVAATGTDDSFSATVSNLAPSTEYSYRAFVTYDNNTVYGGEVTFTTLCGNVQLSIQATKTSICPGVESVTLTASGAETYTWSTNETGASITITAPGHYTVVGQDANGCEGFTDIYIYEEVCAPVPQVATLEPTHDPELYYHYLSGQIVSDNGSAVTECGFCISDGDQEPTYPNSAMSVQNWTGNTFNKNLHVSDFTEGVTYYVRAYARNSAGTGYGETVTIKWPKHPIVNLNDNDITNVTDNSAAATASVELRNCTGIVAAGFCWREIENNVYPTLEDSHTVEAGSTSDYSFSSAITGLTQGIEYIVRAYVTTDENLTVYSGSSYFTTKCGAPTFELSACGDDCVEVTYDLTNTGAMDGIGAYIQYKEAAASVNSWYEEYAFSSPYYISYFLPNTEYEIRVGSHCDFESTSWSESKYFTVPYGSSAPTPAVTSAIPCTITSGHPAQTAALGYTSSGANHGLETVTSDGKINSVTDYDGNEYPVVQIGSQCWLAENMRCTHSPSTGTYLIPAASTGYTFTGKQARWYNNDSATYAPMNYGLLYNWNAAVDTFNTAYGETSVNTSPGNAVSVTFSGHQRGICPAGWHLPSDAEWNTMEATVSGSDWQTSYETSTGYRGSHAGKLAGGDNWTTGTTSGAPGDYGYTDRDVSGFSAVPAGGFNGSFNGAGNRAYFWSSFQHAGNPTRAWYRDLSSGLAGVSRYNDIKYYGYSVRCLRD